jgi:hypothetical protein
MAKSTLPTLPSLEIPPKSDPKAKRPKAPKPPEKAAAAAKPLQADLTDFLWATPQRRKACVPGAGRTDCER